MFFAFLKTDRQRVEEILGKKFNHRPGELYLVKIQPNPDLVFNHHFFKVLLSEDEYDQIVTSQNGWSGSSSPYLPTSWEAPPETQLPWWDATTKTPSNAAVKTIDCGWTVVKFENGYLYGISTKN